MSANTLILGPIAFQAFEVPARILFGGKQRLAVHRLSDGSRAVEALGADDADIIFSGVLSGTEAVIRAQMLDTLRISGAPLELTWDSYLFLVVIREFYCKFENSHWVPYRICCTVTENILSSFGGLAGIATQRVVADLTSAGTLLPSIQPDAGYVAALLERSDTVQSPSTDAAVSSMGTILNTVSAHQADVDMQFAAGVNPSGGPESFASGARLQADNAYSLWSTVIARGLIGRSLSTLDSAGD